MKYWPENNDLYFIVGDIKFEKKILSNFSTENSIFSSELYYFCFHVSIHDLESIEKKLSAVNLLESPFLALLYKKFA